MEIKQFEDKHLSHFSYAMYSNCASEIILVDPARDAQPYLDYAKEKEARITGVIETHAHADFVSSHLELHRATGATIYVSKALGARYPHQGFNEGQHIEFGKIRLTAIDTPGHSPDGICVLVEHDGKKTALFTGDTLFIGDCGRPDLREEAGNEQTSKELLAAQLFYVLQHKLKVLPDDVVVYPAHGAGSLCGKSLSDAKSSTIGEEKATNWSLQPMKEHEFVSKLLSEQPFVPQYFPFDVALNIKGAPAMQVGLNNIHIKVIANNTDVARAQEDTWIVDTRNSDLFKNGHLEHSINIMNGTKFDTWLGSIIRPEEAFYLGVASEHEVCDLLKRCAAIGYEAQVKEVLVLAYANVQTEKIDLDYFKGNKNAFTIIDVRNAGEVTEKPVFPGSLAIPLPELRNRLDEIPVGKPLLVHCASGFRSAAGSSLLQSAFQEKVTVFDLGEAVKEFIK